MAPGQSRCGHAAVTYPKPNEGLAGESTQLVTTDQEQKRDLPCSVTFCKDVMPSSKYGLAQAPRSPDFCVARTQCAEHQVVHCTAGQVADGKRAAAVHTGGEQQLTGASCEGVGATVTAFGTKGAARGGGAWLGAGEEGAGGALEGAVGAWGGPAACRLGLCGSSCVCPARAAC